MLYSFATPQAGEVYQEVDRARAANLDAVFVAGGPHPSALPEEVLEHSISCHRRRRGDPARAD